MMFPKKLKAGMEFKKSVVDSINHIIDYLYTQRINGDNKYIRVNQTPSGVSIMGIKKESSNAVQQEVVSEGNVTPIVFYISSGDSANGWSGYYIQNGYEVSATNMLFVPSLNLNQKIYDKYIVGFKTDTVITGGTEE